MSGVPSVQKLSIRSLSTTNAENPDDEVLSETSVPKSDMERIKEMQDYFAQYAEEYVEIDPVDEEKTNVISKTGEFFFFSVVVLSLKIDGDACLL